MNASSIVVYSNEELEHALSKHKKTQFQPSLAIAFSSPGFAFEKASIIFRECGIGLVGCTSSGEIYDDEILDQSLSLLLMDINPEYVKTVQIRHDNIDAYYSGVQLGKLATNTFDNPGIILFISGVHVVGDGPVAGIKASIDREIPIFGGLAGDNLQHEATYTFTDEGINDFGISAIIFDTDHIQMEGLAVSGWKPLGRTHTVTKAEKNIIYEIDNQPALDLFLNYFDNIAYKLSNKTKNFFTIAGQYPIKIQREDGTSFLRSLLLYDTENRALIAAGKIDSDIQFKFCPPPDFSIIEQTIEQFQVFGKSVPDIEALVMISCKGRHTSFGPLLDNEIKSIYDIWETPMVGFLANGEIGSTKKNGVCEFHNVSCSVVSLKEI